MDKIKDIGFLVFKKHLFWTLGITVVIMGFVAWWMAAGSLAGQYADNKTKVEGAHQKIDTVSAKQTHEIYNLKSHEGIETENTRRAKDVYLAWREKYIRQRRDVLVWPEGLSQDFVDDVEEILNGQPIEEVSLDNKNDLITTRREEFRDQINVLLPQLAELINSKWDPADSSSRGTTGGRGIVRGGGQTVGESGSNATSDDEPLAVTWDPANQGEIVKDHFNFFDEGRTAPTTIQILYAMEDYWVLKAIMQIVARTNTNDGVLSYRRDLSAIRDIESIEIGRSVDETGGNIYLPPTTGNDEEPIEGPGTGSGRGGGAQPGMEGVEFGEGASQVKELADNRYRDKENNPLPAEKLKSAATGKDEADAYLAVAKRMPVRMRVKMDQRKLNKFLVECGNGDLMLEVVQVRINPDGADVTQLAGGTSGGGSPFSRGNRGGRGSGAETGAGSKDEPWDVMVEVYGIIYIFNPPSVERLGISKEDQAKLDAVDLDDTDAAQAAAAEPAEGTPPSTDDPAADDPDADAPTETEPAVEPADGVPVADPPTEEAAARNEPAIAVPAG